MFLPDDPSAYLYHSFPDFVIDAIPGARDLDTALRVAETALGAASAEHASARARLCELSLNEDPRNGPTRAVSRADWDAAADNVRATQSAPVRAEIEYKRAKRALFDHVAAGSEDPSFTDGVNSLFAKASRRARTAFENLVNSLKEREEFASAMGIVIANPRGWVGIDQATSDIDAYIDAGITDRVRLARDVLNEALRNVVGTTARLKPVVDEANAAIEDALAEAADPVLAVRDVLQSRGITR